MTEDDERDLFRLLKRIDRRLKVIGYAVAFGVGFALAEFATKGAQSSWGTKAADWIGAAVFLAVGYFLFREIDRE